MDKQHIIAALQLQPHIEGGYFRRTYSADLTCSTPNATHRPLMSCIYYLLTDDSPIGYFHRNCSDIAHYWHAGSALDYLLISPQGEFSTVTLGPDIAAGEQLQLIVPGGHWKATQLKNKAEYGLLSEAVTPGFDYSDMALATPTQMQKDFPALWARADLQLSTYCKQ